MTIEINEKGSREFYKETVNAVSQYNRLKKDPPRKLKDYFRSFRIYIILCSALLVINALMWIFWGTDQFTIAVAALMIICIVMSAAFLHGMNKLQNSMMSDDRTSVLTLDESGVELNKGDSQIIRSSWDNIVFVRVFSECICFFPKDRSGIVISVDRKYQDRIVPYIESLPSDVMIVK